MDKKDIDYLVEKLRENDLSEIEYEDETSRIRIRKGMRPPRPPKGACPPGLDIIAPRGAERPQAELPANAAEAKADDKGTREEAAPSGNVIKCPLVGTFYSAASPDAKPFVSVGDTVKKGQVVGIVEAMKLMNEIESEFSGTVKEILVENGQLVEYDQPLIVIG